jgi:hypothetical protein
MNTPGFNAEVSLYRSNAAYCAAGVHLLAGAAQVGPSQTLARGFPWPWAKCCGPFFTVWRPYLLPLLPAVEPRTNLHMRAPSGRRATYLVSAVGVRRVLARKLARTRPMTANSRLGR